VRADIEAPSGNGRERLFLALWPPPQAQSEIASIARQLAIEGGRLIAPEHLHVTLVFLGACDLARRECVEQAAASVSVSAFELHLTAVQWRRRSGIVWLTTTEVPRPLTQLVESLNGALEACGFASASRPYRTHLTIARNVSRFRGGREITAIAWRAREYCLVVSSPTSRGSQYAVVNRWPLFAGAAPD